MKKLTITDWIWRFLLLTLLFSILFVAGAGILDGKLPDIASEPGLVKGLPGLLLLAVVNTLLVMSLVVSSKWYGWKLAILLSLAWYGANTFIMQIETWYFLSDLTVSSQLLPLLFVMGMPVAFVFAPLAVWIMGKAKQPDLFLSVPQNLGHILENHLIPQASVRLSHMIETASSTFIFGLVVVWLMHRRHESIG